MHKTTCSSFWAMFLGALIAGTALVDGVRGDPCNQVCADRQMYIYSGGFYCWMYKFNDCNFCFNVSPWICLQWQPTGDTCVNMTLLSQSYSEGSGEKICDRGQSEAQHCDWNTEWEPEESRHTCAYVAG